MRGESKREKVLILDLEETLVGTDGLRKDAMDFIRKASEKFILVLLTNHSEVRMNEILNSYLLKPYFDLTISAVEYDMRKPDPRIIGIIRAMLKDKFNQNFDLKDFWIIGDRPDRDVLLGKLAGIHTIRARWGKYADRDAEFEEERADYEVTTFNEVLDILSLKKRRLAKKKTTTTKRSTGKEKTSRKKKTNTQKSRKKR
jgi:FMN phosphatase YigB (HAD superfamily)